MLSIVLFVPPLSHGAPSELPSFCMQSAPSAQWECTEVTVHPAGYFAPEYTNSCGCMPSAPAPTHPLYGNFTASDELGAAGRVDANWSCYLFSCQSACAVGGILPGQGDWWDVRASYPFPLSQIDGPLDRGTNLQRSVRRTYKRIATDGSCSIESTSSLPVNRFKPISCEPGWSGPQSAEGKWYCYRPKPGPCCAHGNPLDANAGSKVQRETDFSAGGSSPLELVRYYSSARVHSQFSRNPAGRSWFTNFERRLSLYTVTTGQIGITYHHPSGQTEYYLEEAGGAITRSPANPLGLARRGTGWRVTDEGGDWEDFDGEGRLIALWRRGVLAITLTYHADGRVAAATDANGRAIVFSHDTVARRTTVTLPDGRLIRYQLDAMERLESVTYVGAAVSGSDLVRTYLYGEAAQGAASAPFALTGIIDESGIRLATFGYQTTNGVIEALSTERAGSTGRYLISSARYASPVAVTDPVGTVRNHHFSSIAGRRVLSKIEEPCGVGCTATTTFTFDTSGNVASRTDANGNVTQFVHDTARNLETKRSDIVPSGPATCPAGATLYASNYGSSCTSGTCWSVNTFPGSQSAAALGFPGWQYACAVAPPSNTRHEWTQWHATHRAVLKRASPLRLVTYTYHGDAGVSCAPISGQAPLVCSRQEQATTDAKGDLGFGATTTGAPRTWSYTYNALGQVLTIDGPRTDVADLTTFTYYAANDPSGNYRAGDLASVTNAIGHVTTYTHFDGAGRLKRSVDANGLATELDYWPRGWLKSRRLVKSGSIDETTQYDYEPTGNLSRVLKPDGSWIAFDYDDAQRLVGIDDNLGNSIDYTLDKAGNRKEEKTFDPAGTLRRKVTREFDALGRLWKDIDAASQATVMAYDKVGNLLTTTQPASLARPATTNVYDAFRRLIQTTDSEGGVVKYEYDGLDQLVKVTDPRSLATTYAVDGLGNQSALVSPDTGTTTNSLFDAAGNLKQSTDARGKTVTYQYDALNRVTSATWPDQTILYTYDQGVNGKGRLTGITDATGSTQLAYDPAGRVLSDSRVVNGLALSTGYAYDAAGRLFRVTYPSGKQVTYTFDGAGRVSGASVTSGATVPLVSGATYSPFGGLTGFTFGTGSLAYARTFDLDGRVSSYKLGTTTYNLTYDAAGNVTRLSDPANTAQDKVFGYDKADRLLSLTTSPATLNQGFTYDKVGNRLTRVLNGATTNYTLATTSNRLAAVAGVSRTYDLAGNQTGSPGATFTYDDRGRMSGAVTSLGTVGFGVNALGQRVRKTVGTVTTYFAYDREGRLLGEYDGTGQPVQEIAWLGETPVASMRPNGTGFDVFPIWTDHLDTPRLVTNAAGQARWEWPNTDPFGANLANENPASLGAFKFGLRFPGQYFDAETGTHYNYFRDYDPAIGRYVQSDPIGLSGGLNTFGYVGGNPLLGTDETGEASSGSDRHRSGKWKDCGGGCRIRIDENHAPPGRHLHWECRGNSGAMGEFGAISHGGNSGNAPRRVKDCARKHGFDPDPRPTGSEMAICGESCKSILGATAVACGIAFCALQPEICALGAAGFALGR